MEVEKVEYIVDTTPKGVKTFEILMDGLELVEVGTKEVDGKVIEYYKFKIVTKT